MPEDLPNDTEHALPEGRYGDPSDPCLDAAAAAYLGVRLQTVYAMEARGVLKGNNTSREDMVATSPPTASPL
jgi:hypothetical protein